MRDTAVATCSSTFARRLVNVESVHEKIELWHEMLLHTACTSTYLFA